MTLHTPEEAEHRAAMIQDAIDMAYAKGYAAGLEQGEEDGYNMGYNDGYRYGLTQERNFNDSVS